MNLLLLTSLLMNANLYRYLEACREKDLIHSVREGVDTLLMYLYRALNRADDMEKLASSTNWCVVVCAILLMTNQVKFYCNVFIPLIQRVLNEILNF